MKKKLLLIGAIIIASFLSTDGVAQNVGLWAERKAVVDALHHTYGEVPRQLGITADGAVLEIFTTPQGETWSITVTLPNGMTRVIATGENWMVVPAKTVGEKL